MEYQDFLLGRWFPTEETRLKLLVKSFKNLPKGLAKRLAVRVLLNLPFLDDHQIKAHRVLCAWLVDVRRIQPIKQAAIELSFVAGNNPYTGFLAAGMYQIVLAHSTEEVVGFLAEMIDYLSQQVSDQWFRQQVWAALLVEQQNFYLAVDWVRAYNEGDTNDMVRLQDRLARLPLDMRIAANKLLQTE